MAEGTGGWISTRDVRAGARMRLFCLPHAGSGAAGFYRWKTLLRALDIDVCPVLLPGREMRLAEPAARDVESVVAGLMAGVERLVDVPYAIYGHSMGALLAWAWASALRAAGVREPECLIVSGRNAPQVMDERGLLARLPDGEFLAALEARYGAFAPGLMDDPELRGIFLPILRADLGLVERFRYEAGARLGCPVVALAGERDESVTEPGLAGWGKLTSGGCCWERVVGDHFFHLGEGQERLLEVIGERLAVMPV